MKNKSEEQFIIMLKDYEQDSDEKMTKYKQESDEKTTKLSEDFKTMFAVLSYQIDKSNHINTMASSPTQKDKLNPLEPTIVVPANRRAPPLEGGHSTKIGGIWTLKHEISSPKFYELLINTELK